MLLNPCSVCQNRQTGSCLVWLLNPWNIVPNPRLHVLSRQGINIFLVKVFPSPIPFSSHFAASEILRYLYSLWARITSVWNGCWVTVKDAFQQTGGFPAARGGIVPGRESGGDRWGEEKGRKRGAQNGPIAQRPWGIWSGPWLSTHPSWPEAGKRLVSFNSV